MATTTVVPTRTDVLSSKPEKNDKKVDETVSKILKNFPPHEKG